MSETVLCIDPGESAGFSVWDAGHPLDGPSYASTVPGWKLVEAVFDSLGFADAMRSVAEFRHTDVATEPDLLEALGRPDVLVIEDWALYPDPAQPGKLILPAWDKCRTARIIGGLEFVGRMAGLKVVLQPAAIKSAAVAAGAEDFFDRPLHANRHSNDSKMHAVFYFASQGLMSEPGVVIDG